MALAWLFPEAHVIIRGAGDLATGVALRLVRAGFPVIMLERPHPLFVRRTVSAGNAIFEGGRYAVEEIPSVVAKNPSQIQDTLAKTAIAILIDEQGAAIQQLSPPVVVDARMQKEPLDTKISDAPLVIGLGPGYIAGKHCHAVVETNRGHRLGRVIWKGAAEADTGTPGRVAGYDAERVLRAPVSGYVIPANGIEIGVHVEKSDVVATVNGQPIIASFPGMIRGLIHPSVYVNAGTKIGDIDPRDDLSYCYTVSDKALAIGGGVLEAVLSAPQMRKFLQPVETHASLQGA